MATPQILLDINDKDELVRVHGINGNRRTTLARLAPKGGYNTIFWKNSEVRDNYHKHVAGYFEAEKIVITTVLMEGQVADVIPQNAPPRPEKHKMQGDLTPAYLEWLLKWAPIEFQNTLGVELKAVAPGDAPPKDPRDLWVRSDAIRTISGPKPGTNGGEYRSARIIQRDQIIARRASHLTFTKTEILVEERDKDGVLVEKTAPEPYADPYSDDHIEKLEKSGKIEVVWRRHAAASAGAQF